MPYYMQNNRSTINNPNLRNKQASPNRVSAFNDALQQQIARKISPQSQSSMLPSYSTPGTPQQVRSAPQAPAPSVTTMPHYTAPDAVPSAGLGVKPVEPERTDFPTYTPGAEHPQNAPVATTQGGSAIGQYLASLGVADRTPSVSDIVKITGMLNQYYPSMGIDQRKQFVQPLLNSALGAGDGRFSVNEIQNMISYLNKL